MLQSSLLFTSRRCQACAQRSSLNAHFSLTRPARVGPESPSFVEVPQPPQQRSFPPRRLKGVLPVPRDLFPRQRPEKATPEYIAASTPEPSTRTRKSTLSNRASPTYGFLDWRRRLAEKRRHNLRESLVELRTRRVLRDKATHSRAAKKHAERESAVYRRRSEDERLTSPTITAAMQKLQVGSIDDPERATRIADKIARVEGQESEREEEQRNALHVLYMEARDFITTEAQLNDAIDIAFPTSVTGSKAEDRPDRSAPLRSIWDRGPPPELKLLLNQANNEQGGHLRKLEVATRISHERVARIAGELTGGKL